MPQEYSYNDLVKMQEQAIRRVRDMQERARLTMQEHNEGEPPAPPVQQLAEKIEDNQDNTDKNENNSDIAHQKESHTQKQSNPLGNLLNLDKDKAIVLPLLLLLGKESNDNILLLALMYIMA